MGAPSWSASRTNSERYSKNEASAEPASKSSPLLEVEPLLEKPEVEVPLLEKPELAKPELVDDVSPDELLVPSSPDEDDEEVVCLPDEPLEDALLS